MTRGLVRSIGWLAILIGLAGYGYALAFGDEKTLLYSAAAWTLVLAGVALVNSMKRGSEE